MVGPTLTFDRIAQSVVHINSTSGAGVTVKLWQSNDSTITKDDVVAGTNGSFITDKEVSFSGSHAGSVGIINLKAEELDNAGGYKYWTWYFDEVTGNSTVIAVNVVGADAKYGPASDQNVAGATVVK